MRELRVEDAGHYESGLQLRSQRVELNQATQLSYHSKTEELAMGCAHNWTEDKEFFKKIV